MGKGGEGELGVAVEKTGYGLVIFRAEEGAGCVDQAATGPHGSGGRLEKGLLAFQQVVPTVEAEPPPGVGLAAPDAASGAGGIEQNAIEVGVGRRGLEDISVFESDGRTVGGEGRTSFCFTKGGKADFRCQQVDLAKGKIRQVEGFPTRAGAEIPPVFARVGIGCEADELGGDILDLKEPGEMGDEKAQAISLRRQCPCLGEARVFVKRESKPAGLRLEAVFESGPYANPDGRPDLERGQQAGTRVRVAGGKIEEGKRFGGEKRFRRRGIGVAGSEGPFPSFGGQKTDWVIPGIGQGGRSGHGIGVESGVTEGIIEAESGGQRLRRRAFGGCGDPSFPTKPGENGVGEKSAVAGTEIPMAQKLPPEKATGGDPLADRSFHAGEKFQENRSLAVCDLTGSLLRRHGKTIAGAEPFENAEKSVDGRGFDRIVLFHRALNRWHEYGLSPSELLPAPLSFCSR